MRPCERGDPQGQEVHDRGHQRPGPVRQAIEHRAAAGQVGHGGRRQRRRRMVHRRHPRSAAPGRGRRAGVRRRGALEDRGRAAAAASGPAGGRRSEQTRGAGAADRGADRRADRGQPRVGEPGAAGGGGLPAQFHRLGQRPGASELVSHAGVAGVGQDPLGGRKAGRCPRRWASPAPCWLVLLVLAVVAGAVHAGGEGHAWSPCGGRTFSPASTAWCRS